VPYYQFRVTAPTRTTPFIKNLDDEVMRELKQQHGDNYFTVAFAITAWVSLLSDSPLDDPLKPRNLYNRFLRRLLDDYKAEANRLSTLWDELVTSIRRDDYGLQITHFISGFKDTPVFKEYYEFTKTFDPSILLYLSSFLLLGKKIRYQDKSLDSHSLRAWFEVEERIGQVEDNPIIIRALRHIFSEMFNDYEELPFLPVHGNGAVAQEGVHGSNAKNALLSESDQRFQRLLRWNAISQTDLTPWVGQGEITYVKDRTARLKFVWKDMKKSRSICMEPVLLQYAQQGVRLSFEHHLNVSPLLRGHVVIHDQGVNRDGAIFGSDFGSVDTIDLSSASDSVRWSLIKAIFPAKITKSLAATRSTRVQVPDVEQPIEVHKFAPMGSALCFPVQCTLYTGIVILAHILDDIGLGMDDDFDISDVNVTSFLRNRMYKFYSFGISKYQPYRIYGDDIICDTRVTSIVMGLLTSLGFQVNSEKSFAGDQAYRESCGVHALDGVDVTPLTLKIPIIKERLEVSDVASIIDACNAVYRYGFRNLRTHIHRFLKFYPIQGFNKRKGRNQILYSSDPNRSFAILCKCPTNDHLRKRSFDIDQKSNDTRYWYQRDEVYSLTGAAKKVEPIDVRYDAYHFLQWQRSRIHSVGSPLIVQRGPNEFVTRGMRARGRWTPPEE
jgi:hypothetical protein